MATIRSSEAFAETRIPVSIGRVSSRDADRATLLTVATNAGPGTWTRPSLSGSGNGGKSSSRSVRMWNVAAPDTISTSCSAGRSSSVTESPGSERTTSTRSRAGSTTAPSRTTSPSSGTRRPISMSVARSSMPPSAAISWTPESAWTALRVLAARVTVWSCANNASRWVESLISSPASRSIRMTTQVEVTVIGAVDGVHNRGRGRTMREDRCAGPVHRSARVWQPTRRHGRSSGAPSSSVSRRTISNAAGSPAIRSAVRL